MVMLALPAQAQVGIWSSGILQKEAAVPVGPPCAQTTLRRRIPLGSDPFSLKQWEQVWCWHMVGMKEARQRHPGASKGHPVPFYCGFQWHSHTWHGWCWVNTSRHRLCLCRNASPRRWEGQRGTGTRLTRGGVHPETVGIDLGEWEKPFPSLPSSRNSQANPAFLT